MQSKFFCDKYSGLLCLNPTEMNKLQEEFVAYQLLEKNISQTVWNEAIVYDEGKEEAKHYRIDSIWSYISKITNVDVSHRFELLSKVSKLVLVINPRRACAARVTVVVL